MGLRNGQNARTPRWLNCRFGFIQTPLRMRYYDHYFDVAANLAEDFQAELERSRSVIARSPATWLQYLHGAQGYLMKRFPYFVVYRVSRLRKIIAIAHERQRPGYWTERTPPQ